MASLVWGELMAVLQVLICVYGCVFCVFRFVFVALWFCGCLCICVRGQVIWSKEMRLFMIERLALHLVEFMPRLPSNPRVFYQWCPIAKIAYPQLQGELFCNIYYLRNLCNTDRFPDWPIANAVDLLRDVLQAWKAEVERKHPSLTLEECYSTLGLAAEEEPTEAQIRKAYFKAAAKSHPDKNPDPEAAETFAQIYGAYEFLVSPGVRPRAGPDNDRVILLLKVCARKRVCVCLWLCFVGIGVYVCICVSRCPPPPEPSTHCHLTRKHRRRSKPPPPPNLLCSCRCSLHPCALLMLGSG